MCNGYGNEYAIYNNSMFILGLLYTYFIILIVMFLVNNRDIEFYVNFTKKLSYVFGSIFVIACLYRIYLSCC